MPEEQTLTVPVRRHIIDTDPGVRRVVARANAA